jgi:glycosyltransferase involved in cell wall biosynthesis
MTCDALGGIWSYCADLAAGLAAAGIEVVLAGTGPEPAASATAALAARPRWLDLPPTWLAESPDRIRTLAAAIGSLQRETRADLVHLNQPGEAAFLAVDVPVVVAAHSCLTTWWHSVRGTAPAEDWRWRAAIEAEGFRRADAVVAPTASHAAAVAAAYTMATPAVVPNASSAAAGPAGGRTPVVVGAARWWDTGKNLDVLDRAAAGCAWPVRLYGSRRGPDGSAVVARHAQPLGSRPLDEVHRALRHAALLASHSLYEPLGLAALEAARSGATLVLADIPGYRELWNGAAAFFDPRSSAALAGALDALIHDEPRRAALAAAAGGRAAAYTPDAQVAALLEVYDAVGASSASATIQSAS